MCEVPALHEESALHEELAVNEVPAVEDELAVEVPAVECELAFEVGCFLIHFAASCVNEYVFPASSIASSLW